MRPARGACRGGIAAAMLLYGESEGNGVRGGDVPAAARGLSGGRYGVAPGVPDPPCPCVASFGDSLPPSPRLVLLVEASEYLCPVAGSISGVFSHLEMLEAQAHEAGRKEEEKKQQEEKLASLKERVEELRIQRDKLQAKVDLQKKRLSGKERIVSDAAEPSAGAVLEWKIRSLKGMLQLFYLTGISGKLTKQGVCFSISTAYESTYLDSYYLDLLTKPVVRIHRHSVPVFIPLEQIARRYLQTDIRRFLSVLSDHLNAYAGRKYQADQLQEHFSDQLEGRLQRNSLCNLLAFNYKVPSGGKTFPFSARLIYKDICGSLPTEVMVSCTVKVPERLEETAAAHSELFRHMALHKAFCTFSSTEEKLDGVP